MLTLTPPMIYLQEVDSFGGGSVMMWAAISNDHKTNLVHVPGILTAVRYRDKIFQPHLMHVIDEHVYHYTTNDLPHSR
jgi:hypothetical protein